MLNIISILALGFLLGIRHATDPDHVVAVTTIITREHKVSRAALVGICWGIGHTVTIVSLGAMMIACHLVVPIRVGLIMELSVAIMLMMLGFINVRGFMGSMPRRSALAGPAPPSVTHAHGFAGVTGHGPVSWLDQVFAGSGISAYFRPLIVGVMHGLAGSAAIALLVLSTIHDSAWALAYLLLFGIGTVAGMALITVSMASALTMFQVFGAQWSRRIALLSGILSMAFGGLITFQILVVNNLLTSHPNWTPK